MTNPWEINELKDECIEGLKKYCKLIFNDETWRKMFSLDYIKIIEVTRYLKL